MVDVEGPVTTGQLTSAATALLREAGLSDPRREAIRLWRATGGGWLDPDDAAVPPDRAARYRSAAGRRAAGEPFAYVVGSIGFRHLVLACDRRALIPRPETEGLVEVALSRGRQGSAVDVGTGTGAIALSLAHEGAFDRVVGVDISDDALRLARANGIASSSSVDWLRGDLVAGMANASIDLLVANPPYVSEPEYGELDASVKDHEPRLALVGGEDGLDQTRMLLHDGRRVLRPEGWLVLELDCRRAAATAELAAAAGWQAIIVLDDLFGRARYLAARQESNHD